MRFHLILMPLAVATVPIIAGAAPLTNCSHWVGEYVATLRPSDTFTGDATRLRLSIDSRSVSWNVSGEGVPEILLAADRYQCRGTVIRGTFSGAWLEGDFRLTKSKGRFVFDASRVGNDEAAPTNNIGYVPNRAVWLQKVR